MTQLLNVSGLSVRFNTRNVVENVNLTISKGECVALVGESGSGKSVTARSLIGLSGAETRSDTHEFLGRDLRQTSERDWRGLRGKEIGFVLQDAMGSLDPLRPVVSEIDEAVKLHSPADRSARRAEIDRLLMRVGLPRSEELGRRRSEQLSGGQRQRALIASAIAAAPRLLIADEPTTALDASTQSRVVSLLDSLRTDGMGLLLISHDLGVVSRIADRVLVMHKGRIVESGTREQLFTRPSSEHTRLLLSSIPSTAPRGVPLVPGPNSEAPTTASQRRDARLDARGIAREFAQRPLPIRAVDDVEICVRGGRTLGLVGESGSGKSTLARILVGLEKPLEGEVTLDGESWVPLAERKRRLRRRRVGFVSQDSLGSFDPRWNVRRILTDALEDARVSRADRDSAVLRLLQVVRLAPELLERNSAALSGGERQRVSIARALAGDPELLILDEAVSALDASVAAHIMDLFDHLQRARGIGYLLISHDLGVIRHMSDEIAVMRRGRIVERRPTEKVLEAPQHPYTLELLRNVLHVPHQR